jgi:oligopeptidase B
MNDLPSRARPPCAARHPVTSTCHGIARVDDYAWLRDANWQAVIRDPKRLDPEIRSYLEAENAYLAASLADTVPLQEKLFAEMKGRIKEDDESVPEPDGPFAYYRRFVVGGQHPLFCRIPREGGDERILIDGNALAAPHAYFNIASVAHSPDHSLIAYAVDTKGSEYCTVNVIEAETGKLVDSRIEDASGALEWSADSRHLFYISMTNTVRAACCATRSEAMRPTSSCTSRPAPITSSASARRRTGAISSSVSTITKPPRSA